MKTAANVMSLSIEAQRPGWYTGRCRILSGSNKNKLLANQLFEFYHTPLKAGLLRGGEKKKKATMEQK